MPLDVIHPAKRVPVRAAALRIILALGAVVVMLAVLWYSPFARGLRRDQAEARQACEATYARQLEWSIANPDSDSVTVRAAGSGKDAFLDDCLSQTIGTAE